MKKLLLISALVLPTMANASEHCEAMAEFALNTMDLKNIRVSKQSVMKTVNSIKPPNMAIKNEVISIVEWAYSIPYTIKSKTFAVDVYDSCVEFYY